MSNDVKWNDWPSFEEVKRPLLRTGADARTAWYQLVCCVSGLAVLAAVLPGPRTVLAVLTDHPLDRGDGSLSWSTTETAILSAASLLVWVLLIWGLAIGAAAMVGLLPGAPGLAGRSLLRRIAPAAAGRLVAVAVGVGVLAGTSACSVPALTALTSAPSSSAPSTSAPSSSAPSTSAPSTSAAPTAAATSVPSAGLSGALPTESSDSVIASIGIDWPDPGRPGATPTDVVPTGATASPTTTAPETPTGTTPAPPASSTDSADPAADEPGSDGPSSSTDAAPQPSGAPGAASVDHSSESPAPASTGEAGAADPGAVTVEPGDCLWSIAAAHLPAESSDAAIDTAWRAWFSTNRQAIGDDPDLIVPGQFLLPPNAK